MDTFVASEGYLEMIEREIFPELQVRYRDRFDRNWRLQDGDPDHIKKTP